MSASFYDLMKYAKTGIASPDMTAYDKMRALAMAGGAKYPVATITGVPPLPFRADGRPLSAWSIAGNNRQEGADTPEFVGEKTENIFDVVAFAEYAYESRATIARNGNTIILTATNADAYINQVISNGNTTPGQYQPSCISVEPETEYTIHLSKAPKCYISWLDDSFLAVADFTRIPASNIPTSYTFTTPAGCTQILFRIGEETTVGSTFQFSDIMLVKGSTVPSYYIPYGYKINITNAGQTTTIYIGDPLRKAIDGSDAVDVLYSTGTITRAVDEDGNALETQTTQIIDAPPEIQTVRGSNTLTVDTSVQPSSVSITGHIKQM